MPKYEITYNLRGQITIEANSYGEARKDFYNADITETAELFEGVEHNIMDLGNDAIEILDIQKEDE